MKKQTALDIPADHPAFAGHFPGTPIVPGVLLLDEVLHTIYADTGLDETAWQISSVKFLSPLTPHESVVIEHEKLSNGSVKFQVFKVEESGSHRQIVLGSLVGNDLT